MSVRHLLAPPLARTGYLEALELQRRLAGARISGALQEDVLLLVEHPSVVTLGRSTKMRNLTTPRSFLNSLGVEVHEVERGGDVTYHGPGQLVGYPILDLQHHTQDLHWYLRQVEEVLIRACAVHGLESERSEGFTGVWTGGRKLASIGVHSKSWVTWHGFALNVCTDLSYFDLIVPCGIADVSMTSLARELGDRSPGTELFADTVLGAFCDVFALSPRACSFEELGEVTGEVALAG